VENAGACLLQAFGLRCWWYFRAAGEGFHYYMNPAMRARELAQLEGLVVALDALGVERWRLGVVARSALMLARRDDSTVPLQGFPHSGF